MKRTIPILLALLALVASSGAAVTYSQAFDRDVHEAILIITFDDWADSEIVACATEWDIPISFGTSGNYLDQSETRQRWAWQADAAGIEFGFHDSTTIDSSMHEDELETYFDNVKQSLSAYRFRRIEPWFVHVSSKWTTESEQYLRDDGYFEWWRGREVSGVNPDGSIDSLFAGQPFAGNFHDYGFSLGMAGRHIKSTVGSSFNPTYGVTSSDDTTGCRAATTTFLNAATARGNIVWCSFHNPDTDVGKEELWCIWDTARKRGDVWITSPGRAWDALGAQLAANDAGAALYASGQNGRRLAAGTRQDPFDMSTALLGGIVGRTIHVRDTTDFDALGLDGQKIEFGNTWVGDGTAVWTCASGAIDLNSGVYFNNVSGFDQVVENVELLALDNTAVGFVNVRKPSSKGVAAGAGNDEVVDTWFVDCPVTVAADNGFYTEGHDLHFVGCDMTMQSSDSDGAQYLIRMATAADSLYMVNVTVTFETGAIASKYAARTNTVANSVFQNLLFVDAATAPASGAFTPIWFDNITYIDGAAAAFVDRGNSLDGILCVTDQATCDFTLETTTPTIEAFADSCGATRVWRTSSAAVGDTTRFGGLLAGLDAFGAAHGTNHASIGATQYTADPWVSPTPRASLDAGARIESPWELLSLIDAGVLSASDSLDSATWYALPMPTSAAEELRVQLFLDAYNDWPAANRQKIRWRVP